MQYAIKYQLSNHHTGRVHDTLEQAILDLDQCQQAATADEQGICIVAVEHDTYRHLTDEEMAALAALAE